MKKDLFPAQKKKNKKKEEEEEEREYYVFSVRRAPKLILGLSHNLIYIFQVCVYATDCIPRPRFLIFFFFSAFVGFRRQILLL